MKNEDNDFVEYMDSEFAESEDDVVKKPAKLAYVWTDNDIVKLISEVESHTCIWDCRSKEYKNKTNRKNAWREIANSLQNEIPVQQLSVK